MRCVFTTLSRLVHCTPPVGVCIVKKNDEPRRRRFYAIEKMRQFDKNTRTSLPKILRLKSSLFYICLITNSRSLVILISYYAMSRLIEKNWTVPSECNFDYSIPNERAKTEKMWFPPHKYKRTKSLNFSFA